MKNLCFINYLYLVVDRSQSVSRHYSATATKFDGRICAEQCWIMSMMLNFGQNLSNNVLILLNNVEFDHIWNFSRILLNNVNYCQIMSHKADFCRIMSNYVENCRGPLVDLLIIWLVHSMLSIIFDLKLKCHSPYGLKVFIFTL